MPLNARQRPERREQMIELRRVAVEEHLLAHHPYREIARLVGEQLGSSVSIGTIASDVVALRQRWRTRHAEEWDAQVAEQIAVLDALERTLLPFVLEGLTEEDEDRRREQLHAVRELRMLRADRAKLLGLNRPTRLEVSGSMGIVVSTPLDQELEALLTAPAPKALPPPASNGHA